MLKNNSSISELGSWGSFLALSRIGLYSLSDKHFWVCVWDLDSFTRFTKAPWAISWPVNTSPNQLQLIFSFNDRFCLCSLLFCEKQNLKKMTTVYIIVRTNYWLLHNLTTHIPWSNWLCCSDILRSHPLWVHENSKNKTQVQLELSLMLCTDTSKITCLVYLSAVMNGCNNNINLVISLLMSWIWAR